MHTRIYICIYIYIYIYIYGGRPPGPGDRGLLPLEAARVSALIITINNDSTDNYSNSKSDDNE